MDPEDPESDRKETLDSTRRAVSVAFHGIVTCKNLLRINNAMHSAINAVSERYATSSEIPRTRFGACTKHANMEFR